MTMTEIPAEARFTCRHTGEQFVRVACVSREEVAYRSAGFGVFDNKGREFGHRYTIIREVHAVDEASSTRCPTLISVENLDTILGETFAFEPHAMRGGIEFGAIPVRSRKRFRTLAEAEDHAAKAMARAEHNAVKKASA